MAGEAKDFAPECGYLKLVVEDGMQRLYESVDAWLKEEKISK